VSFTNSNGVVTTFQTSTSGTNWTLNLNSSDITSLGQGNFTVSVKSTDPAQNASTVTTASVKIDTVVAAPTETFVQTGQVGNTLYAKSGVVTVGLEDANSTWEYKVNGGAWKAGTGTSLTVSGDGAKTIDVRQTDAAGNLSATNSISFTLDTSVAAPIIKITDTGVSSTDRITNNGNVLLTNLEANATATWQYSKDGGSTWLTQTGGTTLNLNTDPVNHTSDGTYLIRVQQVDAAGNISQLVSTNLTLRHSSSHT